MTVNLLTKQHLEFLSLTEACTGSSESTLVKVPHSWKSHVGAHMRANILVSKQKGSKTSFRKKPLVLYISKFCNVDLAHRFNS